MVLVPTVEKRCFTLFIAFLVDLRSLKVLIILQSGFELGADVIAACKDEAKSVPEESMDAESEDLSTATEIKQKVQDEETIIEPGGYMWHSFESPKSIMIRVSKLIVKT